MRTWLVLGAASSALALAASPTVPGPMPDGSVRLHNQWAIHPVGRQIEVGDYPAAEAMHPSGRWVAVLHAGYRKNEVRIIDLQTGETTSGAALGEAFGGIAFSADGGQLVCGGASEGVLHIYGFSEGRLSPPRDVRVFAAEEQGVVSGFALSGDGRSAVVARAFDSRVSLVDLEHGTVSWTVRLKGAQEGPAPSRDRNAPNAVLGGKELVDDADPFHVAWNEASGMAYVTNWGEASVDVVDTRTGTLTAQWPCGLHPNDLVLSADGRLFVSNGGVNSVTVFDTASGRVLENLNVSLSAEDLPGSTPSGLALTRDGLRLYVSCASSNTVAVFDVSEPGRSRALGFVPAGWYPLAVAVTPDGTRLAVANARGVKAKPSGGGGQPTKRITQLYQGTVQVVDLGDEATRARNLSDWTALARGLRPVPPESASVAVPAPGGPSSPVRHVIYIVKENRTYDQVFGDMPQGNGDPSLCLFPEKVTPNIHAIARQFVLLDNFYANAEISASGHEWSMAGYSSEFVERSWPVNYGSRKSHVPYPAEGHYLAATPALGYLWDRAAQAGVSYRSYGEFTVENETLAEPVVSNMPALKDHVDRAYQGWRLDYPDRERAKEFIAQLRTFEAKGEMPRLQILRLPQDHTAGQRKGDWTPRAMLADNDLAVGQVVDAVSHTRFWGSTAIFIVEDDAQDGPDHVDAHRTEALVAGAFVRRGVVDSTPYTTCSMLRTIERILGLAPMSQFDEHAPAMTACFSDAPDLSPYDVRTPGIDLEERNTRDGREASISGRLDFSAEDRADESLLNAVVWDSVKPGQPMPAPVHAAFVRAIPLDDDD